MYLCSDSHTINLEETALTMRKDTLIMLWVATLVMTVARAAPVGRQAAERKARAFLTARHPHRSPTLALAPPSRRKSAGRATTDDYYYVFNNGDGDGFVIVSGDDSTAEVLGYADSGSLDLDHLPDQLQVWLDGYAEEIAHLRAAQATTYTATTAVSTSTAEATTPTPAKAPATTEEPVAAKKMVPPLLATQWTQNAPFNLYCTTGTGAQAVVGCVAVTLAQVMYYYRSPQKATTAIPSYTITKSGTTYTFAKLAATTFAWEKMRDVYSSNDATDDEAVVAVAQLMHYCANALQTDYGESSATAYTMQCVTALGSYFGYAGKGEMVNRSSYSNAEWEELIYNELCHGRPVIYSARTSKDAGHSFVCDGYDGDGLFHINWGWGGLSDGYFRLQVLNPSQQGTGSSVSTIGYSIGQQAVVGISPTAVEDNDLLKANDRIHLNSFSLASGAATTYTYTGAAFTNVKATFNYKSPYDGKYTLGFGIYQGDQRLQARTIGTYTVKSGYNYNFSSVALGNIGANLADGVYQVKCLSCLSGTTEWKVDNDGDKRYLQLTIANGKATFAAKVEQPPLQLVAIEQHYGGTTTRRLLRVRLRNMGTEHFNSQLVLTVGGTEYGREDLYLDGGEEGYVDFVFTYVAKSVALQLTVDDTGEVLYNDKSFAIEAKEAGAIDLTSCTLEHGELVGMKWLGNTVEAVAELRNNTSVQANDRVKLMIYYFTDDASTTSIQVTQNVSLAPGETQTIRLDYRQLAVGQRVWFFVQTSKVSKAFGNKSKPYTVVAAYSEWDGSGQRTAKELGTTVKVSAKAAAVSFEGLNLTGVTITPNTNPNTLYYLDTNATTPSKLSGKNVVKGSKAAANITLAEGYDSWVPRAFDVSGTISYSRKATTSCNGNSGWQTIALPFAVAKATVDGKEVKFDGSDGALMLRTLTAISGDWLLFDDASEWLPSTPYLIGTPAAMVGKTMKLSATGVKVQATGQSVVRAGAYDFVGTSSQQTLQPAYVLNASGDAFTLTAKAVVAAGTACFTPHTASSGNVALLRFCEQMLGDVNGDGTITVTDVMLLVGYIAIGEQAGFVAANADVNGDGNITVADTMLVVEMIMAP